MNNNKRDKIITGVLIGVVAIIIFTALMYKEQYDREKIMTITMREIYEAETEAPTYPPRETEATAAETEAPTEAETTHGGNEAKKWLSGITIPTHTFIEETDAPTARQNTETTPEVTTEMSLPTEPSTAPTTPETTTEAIIYVEPTEAPPVPVLTQNIILSDEDAMYLVKTASCEAGNQGVYGMALIMRVVLNRSQQRGMSIHDVLYEPEQFNCVYGDWWASGYIADGVYEALAMIQSGWDESYGATFFCTPQRNTWHMSHLTFLFQYGNMQFYK